MYHADVAIFSNGVVGDIDRVLGTKRTAIAALGVDEPGLPEMGQTCQPRSRTLLRPCELQIHVVLRHAVAFAVLRDEVANSINAAVSRAF